jgi:hypothetical protein
LFTVRSFEIFLAIRGFPVHPACMASSKKLTRADVHKQIDAFRGIVKQNPGDKPTAGDWAESKRAEKELSTGKFQRPSALNGKSAI